MQTEFWCKNLLEYVQLDREGDGWKTESKLLGIWNARMGGVRNWFRIVHKCWFWY